MSDIFSKTSKSHREILPAWQRVYTNTQQLKIKNPREEKDKWLIRGRQARGNKYLVHTIRDFKRESPLLSRGAETLMSGWDVISTSIVQMNNNTRTQWADVGLILAVPPQNIISTFSHDVNFPNHAGNEPGKPKNRFALADSYFNGITKNKSIVNGNTYANLATPTDILRRTLTGEHGTGILHNEILAVGRSDVRTYEGYGPTQRIQVCGIYYHQSFTDGKEKDIRIRDKNIALVRELFKHNRVPVILDILDPYSHDSGYDSLSYFDDWRDKIKVFERETLSMLWDSMRPFLDESVC